jgi:hypothetical protein
VNILKANILGLAIGSLSYPQDAAILVHAAPVEATYADVLNEAKKEGYSLESASKDAGIKTTLQVTGHYKQTGSHLEITFISDNGHTTVRVTQMEQHRYKAFKDGAVGRYQNQHGVIARCRRKAQSWPRLVIYSC